MQQRWLRDDRRSQGRLLVTSAWWQTSHAGGRLPVALGIYTQGLVVATESNSVTRFKADALSALQVRQDGRAIIVDVYPRTGDAVSLVVPGSASLPELVSAVQQVGS